MASAHACAHYLPMHLSLHQQAGLLHNGCKLACIIFVTMLRGGPLDGTSQQASPPQPPEAHHHCALSMRTVLSESETRLQQQPSFDAPVTPWLLASDTGVGLPQGGKCAIAPPTHTLIHHIAVLDVGISALRGCLQKQKRTEKTTPFGVDLMRSQVLYRAAQMGVSATDATACQLAIGLSADEHHVISHCNQCHMQNTGVLHQICHAKLYASFSRLRPQLHMQL